MRLKKRRRNQRKLIERINSKLNNATPKKPRKSVAKENFPEEVEKKEEEE